MMNGILSKLGIVVLTGGLITISGFSIHHSITPKTFGDVLSKENHKLLKSEAQEWEQLIKKHEESKQNSNEETKPIQELDLNSDDKKKKIMDKCKELWEKELSSVTESSETERIQKELKNWCVENPAAITEKAKNS